MHEIKEMDLQVATCPPAPMFRPAKRQQERKHCRLAARRRRRELQRKRGHKSILTKFGVPKNVIRKGQDVSSYDELNQFSLFDINNKTVSPFCKCCDKESITSAELLFPCAYCNSSSCCSSPGYTSSRTESECTCQSTTFQSGELILAGDWEYLAKILGYTGPNGVHFCPFCLCKISDMPKGVPHAPIIFHRYKHENISGRTFSSRTFQGMENDQQAFIYSGQSRTYVSSYNNCEHPSMVNATGLTINSLSVMPLHLALGLGL